MLKRIFSSFIIIPLIIAGLFNKWFFLLLILIFTVGGLYEFFYLAKKKGIPIYDYTGILIGVLIPLTTFFRFQPTKGWELLFIVLVLGTVFILQFRRKDNNNALIGISTTLFGILYVSWLFSFTIKVRFLMADVSDWAGLRLLAFVLLVTKFGDVGALLIGKVLGKHPLLPTVSPKKTIEGGLGGLLMSAFIALLAFKLMPPELGLTLWQVVLMGAALGIIGQLGDMSESQIKRDCNVKDSGKLMPGLGGVLDMIDSLLFAVPVFYFFISAILQ
ncbi:MAG: phosphatidate cytidylyltransferase [Candidatus Omnitrophica bacterium]|nr:phosphatidate cytidylyltransferase [Candidatus Omnitrophota bacterium]